MKMMKTVKGKLVAGTVAVGLVAGGGFALANTDAGTQLQNWYNKAFGDKTEAIDSQVTAYGESLVPGLYNEYNGKKNAAGNTINLTRDQEIAAASSAINNAKNSHLESLEGTKAEILENIGLQFNDVFHAGYLEILASAQQAQAYAENDLSAYTSEKGTAAVAKVTTDLEAAQNAAVSELEAAIEAAKAAISAELDNQEEIVVRNLKNWIGWTVEDLREEVTTILNGLVAQQQAIIETAAAELEAEAITALDNVVSGINE